VVLIDNLVHVLWFSYIFVSIGQIGKFFRYIHNLHVFHSYISENLDATGKG
jgi:hypothetical protein